MFVHHYQYNVGSRPGVVNLTSRSNNIENVANIIFNTPTTKEVNVECTPYTLQILSVLNQIPHVPRLVLKGFSETFTWYDTIFNFLRTNSTVSDLCIDIQNFQKWNEFVQVLSQNKVITRLEVVGIVPADRPAPAGQGFAQYIATNTTLKALAVCVGDDLCDSGFFDALIKNRTLTWIAIDTFLWKPHNKMDPIISKLIAGNQSLKSLGLSQEIPTSATCSLIAKSLVANTVLTHLECSFQKVRELNKFVKEVDQNRSLVSVDFIVMSDRGDVERRFPFIERNKAIAWKTVHATLLTFTLIFHRFPPYAILAIFDVAPFMNLVNYQHKIGLIMSIHTSITKMRQARVVN